MTKKENIEEILTVLARYNRKMYAYGRDYRQYGTEHQLCQEQIHLISKIGHNPGCNIQFLADQTCAVVPTVSLRVNRLEKLGLICKRRSLSSQREVEINLTEEGQRAFLFHEALDDKYFSHAAQDLDKYSDQQLDTILDFLSDLMEWGLC